MLYIPNQQKQAPPRPHYKVICSFHVAGDRPSVLIMCCHLPLPLSFLSMYFNNLCLLWHILRKLLLLFLSL